MTNCIVLLEERLCFVGIIVPILFKPDKMKNKIVDHIGRNPRGAEGYVNFIGIKIGINYTLKRFDIIIKDSGILLVCLLCNRKLVHQVARKIFIGRFPPLVIALLPVERILIDTAFQCFNNSFHFLARNRGNKLNINKMTVDDITAEGDTGIYSMKVQIELQGDLYNVKNLVQQLYDSETLSRINSFSYRLEDNYNLMWMWRSIDDESLVPWWDMTGSTGNITAPGQAEEEKPLCADDLLAHGAALCYLEIEFLGVGA